MRANRRQFVLGPRAVAPARDWVAARVPGVGVLSHCPDLKVAEVRDRDGGTWHLLGLAVEADPGRATNPVQEIGAARTESVVSLTQTWAGRWLLIGDGQVHLDAGSLLGCFYRVREGGAGEREVWASSSAGLLVDASERSALLRASRPLRHEVGMDWYPPPSSRFPPVRSLLPSQVLLLASGRVIARRLIPRIETPLSYAESLDVLEGFFVTAVRRVAEQAGAVYLPLTGGWDSRLLLAAAHRAGVPFDAFTLLHKSISRGDRSLPPLLAEAVGVRHLFVPRRERRRHVEALCDEHTSGHAVGADPDHLAHGMYEWSRPGDVILRGGALEVARCFYWRRLAAADPAWAVPDARVVVKGFREQDDPTLLQAIGEWSAWAAETPHREMDWRDRLYLEQRIGGWVSAVEQLLDLIDADRFYAVNARATVAHLLHLPSEQRRLRFDNVDLVPHFYDLIERMAPQLVRFPFNPPDARYRTLKKRLRRAAIRTARRVRAALGA